MAKNTHIKWIIFTKKIIHFVSTPPLLVEKCHIFLTSPLVLFLAVLTLLMVVKVMTEEKSRKEENGNRETGGNRKGKETNWKREMLKDKGRREKGRWGTK